MMGMGEGISGVAEGIAEDWEDITGDFCEGSDNSGSWASRGFCRSSYKVLFQKKDPLPLSWLWDPRHHWWGVSAQAEGG